MTRLISCFALIALPLPSGCIPSDLTLRTIDQNSGQPLRDVQVVRTRKTREGLFGVGGDATTDRIGSSDQSGIVRGAPFRPEDIIRFRKDGYSDRFVRVRSIKLSAVEPVESGPTSSFLQAVTDEFNRRYRETVNIERDTEGRWVVPLARQ